MLFLSLFASIFLCNSYIRKINGYVDLADKPNMLVFVSTLDVSHRKTRKIFYETKRFGVKAGNTRTDSAIQDKVAERIRLNDLAKSFLFYLINSKVI